MADPKIVREWMDKAEEDYRFAETALAEGSGFYAQICFHFHQAAEKYLKSFIVAHNLEFEKIHDLTALLKICVKKAPSLSSLHDECEILGPAYIDTRYPVHWPTNYTKEKAEQAKNAARKIADSVKSLLTIVD